MKHYSFPSISQFREVVETVGFHATYTGRDENDDPIYDSTLPKPIINFEGTTKLHGANSSIVFLKTGEIYFQSREIVLSIHEDSYGFCNYMTPLKNKLIKLIEGIEFKEYIVIYGEWCGKGIQKGTAINNLEKMFVIFAAKKESGNNDGKSVYFDFYNKNEELKIYNIHDFPKKHITIDFNKPEIYLDQLAESTKEVEEKCPVANHFGFEGTGEGIVWVGHFNDHTYRFKIKGEKHSLKSKEKKIVALDIDKYNSITAFVADNLSINRLEQGLSILESNSLKIEIKNIVVYLKWCAEDIFKECKAEIEASNLDQKMLYKEITTVARKFFINYLNTHLN